MPLGKRNNNIMPFMILCTYLRKQLKTIENNLKMIFLGIMQLRCSQMMKAQ